MFSYILDQYCFIFEIHVLQNTKVTLIDTVQLTTLLNIVTHSFTKDEFQLISVQE